MRYRCFQSLVRHIETVVSENAEVQGTFEYQVRQVGIKKVMIYWLKENCI